MRAFKILFYISFIICFLACNNENSKNDIVKTESEIVNTNKVDTTYKDDKTIIVKSEKSVDTLIYFISNIDNKTYNVKEEHVLLTKKLNFSNYEFKKMFKTTTLKGVEENGVNFAGHFCFVYWGCGSTCKLSAVVDMKTGIVYNGLHSEIGYEFKINSNILVVNPPDETGFYNKNIMWQQPSEYIWTGKTFKKLNEK